VTSPRGATFHNQGTVTTNNGGREHQFMERLNPISSVHQLREGQSHEASSTKRKSDTGQGQTRQEPMIRQSSTHYRLYSLLHHHLR